MCQTTYSIFENKITPYVDYHTHKLGEMLIRTVSGVSSFSTFFSSCQCAFLSNSLFDTSFLVHHQLGLPLSVNCTIVRIVEFSIINCLANRKSQSVNLFTNTNLFASTAPSIKVWSPTKELSATGEISSKGFYSASTVAKS